MYAEKYKKYLKKYLEYEDMIGGGKKKIPNSAKKYIPDSLSELKSIHIGSSVIKDEIKKNLDIHGSGNITDSIIKKNLNVAGEVNFKKIRVDGSTKVSGEITGSNGKFKDLYVNGAFQCDKCEILKINTSGSLKANNSNIDSIICAGSIKLDKCRVDSIKLSATTATIKECNINKFSINIKEINPNNKIKIFNSKIKNLTVVGPKINIYVDKRTKIDNIKNAIISIMN